MNMYVKDEIEWCSSVIQSTQKIINITVNNLVELRNKLSQISLNNKHELFHAAVNTLVLLDLSDIEMFCFYKLNIHEDNRIVKLIYGRVMKIKYNVLSKLKYFDYYVLCGYGIFSDSVEYFLMRNNTIIPYIANDYQVILKKNINYIEPEYIEYIYDVSNLDIISTRYIIQIYLKYKKHDVLKKMLFNSSISQSIAIEIMKTVNCKYVFNILKTKISPTMMDEELKYIEWYYNKTRIDITVCNNMNITIIKNFSHRCNLLYHFTYNSDILPIDYLEQLDHDFFIAGLNKLKSTSNYFDLIYNYYINPLNIRTKRQIEGKIKKIGYEKDFNLLMSKRKSIKENYDWNNISSINSVKLIEYDKTLFNQIKNTNTTNILRAMDRVQTCGSTYIQLYDSVFNSENIENDKIQIVKTLSSDEYVKLLIDFIKWGKTVNKIDNVIQFIIRTLPLFKIDYYKLHDSIKNLNMSRIFPVIVNSVKNKIDLIEVWCDTIYSPYINYFKLTIDEAESLLDTSFDDKWYLQKILIGLRSLHTSELHEKQLLKILNYTNHDLIIDEILHFQIPNNILITLFFKRIMIDELSNKILIKLLNSINEISKDDLSRIRKVCELNSINYIKYDLYDKIPCDQSILQSIVDKLYTIYDDKLFKKVATFVNLHRTQLYIDLKIPHYLLKSNCNSLYKHYAIDNIDIENLNDHDFTLLIYYIANEEVSIQSKWIKHLSLSKETIKLKFNHLILLWNRKPLINEFLAKFLC